MRDGLVWVVERRAIVMDRPAAPLVSKIAKRSYSSGGITWQGVDGREPQDGTNDWRVRTPR
jgi:hypothetical protein